MENASKALIIAGAILLSILLISLGIMIFNQAQDATKNSGMSKAEISTYNAQYTKYEGKQSGSTVKSLIQEANVNNASDTANGSSRQVAVYFSDAAKKDGVLSTSDISPTTRYTVKIESYDGSGYVSGISITKP